MKKGVFKAIIENKLVYWVVRLTIALQYKISIYKSHFKLKALISKVGNKSFCHHTVEIKYGENIEIGYHSSIGPYSCLGAKSTIKIGSYVRISRGVIIETAGLD